MTPRLSLLAYFAFELTFSGEHGDSSVPYDISRMADEIDGPYTRDAPYVVRCWIHAVIRRKR